MSNRQKTEFLIVGPRGKNEFVNLLETTDMPITGIDLNEFVSTDIKRFKSMLFMPGYFEWGDDFAKKELILKKIKNFTDRGGNLYAEYVQCDDYILRKIFLFTIKQNHPPRPVALERIIVTGEHYITGDFSKMTILPVRNCVFLPCHAKMPKTILSFGVVLGTHRVIHEMPPGRDIWPALLANDKGGVFATFELSKYKEKDFPLRKCWGKILKRIILFLIPKDQREQYEKKFFPVETILNKPDWATVHDEIKIKTDRKAEITVFSPESQEKLPVKQLKGNNLWQFIPQKEGTYIISAKDTNGEINKQEIVISQREKKYKEVLDNLMKWYLESGVMPKKDGSAGVYEGFRSTDHKLIPIFRSDCNTTTAETMFLYGQLIKNDSYKKIAKNIVDFLIREGYQDLNARHETYGCWKFYTNYRDYPVSIWENDNSWASMALFSLYKWTGDKNYLDHALLTSENIYRNQLLEKEVVCVSGEMLNALGAGGYRKKIESWPKNIGVHVPVMYVYAYKGTGDEKYLKRAEQCTRLLLKKKISDHHLELFSLLYQATGKEEYKEKIDAIMENVKKILPPYRMSESSEYMRKQKGVELKKTNKLYGVAEVDIKHSSKDPIVDQLYTTSSLVMFIYAAYKATGNKEYLECFYRQMDFLARIQIHSRDKRFNGAWMRAFDYKNWDYYGSNGDIDWGPYCIESGWCNTWIGRALALYLMDEAVI